MQFAVPPLPLKRVCAGCFVRSRRTNFNEAACITTWYFTSVGTYL